MIQENIYVLYYMMAVTCIFMLGFVFFQRWRKAQRIKRPEELTEQRKQLETMQKQMAQLLKSTLKSQEELQRKAVSKDSDEKVGLNSGGYIIFDVPEPKKEMFHDLMKGFQDYAKLCGYVVSFSIDNTFRDKVAFKFTLDGEGVAVSTGRVRQDIQDYVDKVQRGDSLDDLQVVLTPLEHKLILTRLKNRLSFVEHNYNFEKKAHEMYKDLLGQFSNGSLGLIPAQNIYIYTGKSKSSNYSSHNSPQSVQGVGNRQVRNKLDQSIYIASSITEKAGQIEALTKLSSVLCAEKNRAKVGRKKKLGKADEFVLRAKQELEKRSHPDPLQIQKWLETAKQSIKTFALTKEVVDSAKVVWNVFKMDW